MTVARAAVTLARPRQAASSLVQRRLASTHHDEHHGDHHHEQDAIAFPKEDFSSAAWRNFTLFGLAVAAWYKFAPDPREDNYIARWIEHYKTPTQVWQSIAFKNLTLELQNSDENLLTRDAKRPAIHRYRYTQRFEQHSPFIQPVGQDVDLSDLVIKRE
ncbi:hypothetical protein WOLCODRAFT_104021 [Wolfiporia cocos MD-104 SS10]|uniref:Uncharacterized protein n=1 Tax=Wolfiporia cocos (strain MD-104) TaxID=742152 RepID=A0A2H3JUS2_WOLCO|nr:hypothetical protein WOLCODRAFT_104021 [Wolfiporia cocos MD-104 SS10]